jgi:hypothetical protein
MSLSFSISLSFSLHVCCLFFSFNLYHL